METAQTVVQEQRRREAIQHGLAQVRLEGMEPPLLFFEVAERYIHGEITLAEAIACIKVAAQAHPSDTPRLKGNL